MSNYHRNSSSIGTATHLEQISPPHKNKTSATRKGKHKCIHYNHETKLCELLNIECVGPYHPLCNDYITDNKPQTKMTPQEGTLVNCPTNGVGMVTKVLSANAFEVRFHKSDRIKHYNLSELQSILLK